MASAGRRVRPRERALATEGGENTFEKGCSGRKTPDMPLKMGVQPCSTSTRTKVPLTDREQVLPASAQSQGSAAKGVGAGQGGGGRI